MDKLRSDLEGDMCQDGAPPGAVYAKRLDFGRAWYADSLEDLTSLEEVERVEVEAEESIWICYRPGLYPLDWQALRGLLPLDGPLALWRLALLGARLAGQLEALHDARLPQMLIHPQRLARLEGGLTLLPSLAAPLPPWGQKRRTGLPAWLRYLDPEVMRWRGLREEGLEAADIYALGRTLESLAAASLEPPALSACLPYVASRVEAAQPDPFGQAAPGLEPLGEVIARLCQPRPADRPSATQARQTLQDLAQGHCPQQVMARFLGRGMLKEAKACLDDLERTIGGGVFRLEAFAAPLMAADLELAQPAPNFTAALASLKKAEMLGAERGIHLRRARAYARFTTHPDHLLLSSQAYSLAFEEEGRSQDIWREWRPFLDQVQEPGQMLAQTEAVPCAMGGRALCLRRARAWLEQGKCLPAWAELNQALAQLGFDPELFEVARQASQGIAPLDMMRMMTPFRDNPAYAASVALMWERNGNMQLARESLLSAFPGGSA